ncbi:hypothetical protein EFT87_14985, partial [Schleiferilactobacillus harbinensis]
HTAALPPMWLGDLETAQRAPSAVTTFQPILPELAEHLARRTENLSPNHAVPFYRGSPKQTMDQDGGQNPSLA